MIETNYELKYAYAEVYEIIEHLSEKTRNKIPKDVVEKIKSGRKFGYKPEFDYSKPLEDQIERQETINLIAYLYYYFLCNSEDKKKRLEDAIKENIKIKKQYEAEQRKEEIGRKASQNVQSIDAALKTLNK